MRLHALFTQSYLLMRCSRAGPVTVSYSDKVSSKNADMTRAMCLQFFPQLCQTWLTCWKSPDVPALLCALASRSFAWPSRFAAGSYILSIISERKWVSGTVSYCGCSTMHFCLDKTAAALLIIMDAAVWKRAAVELAWPNGVSSILHYHRVCCCLPCCVINSCVYH